MYLFDCCMGKFPWDELVGQMYVLLVSIAELPSKDKLTEQQLRNCSLLCCANLKHYGTQVLFCILLITGECEHLQNGYGIYVFLFYKLHIDIYYNWSYIVLLLICKVFVSNFFY